MTASPERREAERRLHKTAIARQAAGEEWRKAIRQFYAGNYRPERLAAASTAMALTLDELDMAAMNYAKALAKPEGAQ